MSFQTVSGRGCLPAIAACSKAGRPAGLVRTPSRRLVLDRLAKRKRLDPAAGFPQHRKLAPVETGRTKAALVNAIDQTLDRQAIQRLAHRNGDHCITVTKRDRAKLSTESKVPLQQILSQEAVGHRSTRYPSIDSPDVPKTKLSAGIRATRCSSTYMLSIITWPKPEQLTWVEPSSRRAKS